MPLLASLRVRIPLAILRGVVCRVPEGVVTQVLVGRNDDYGDRPVERLLACISWNQRWLRCRTVFVEWNPPADRPLLSHMLAERFREIDCYVVPNELHAAAVGPGARAFQEFHAKNVGIRRARTPWVVSMNTDILAGPDTRRSLRGLVRADRRDVVFRTRRVDIPFGGRCPGLPGVLNGLSYLRFRCIGSSDASAPGDFTLASRELWHRAGAYDEAQVDRRVICDCRGVRQLLACGGRIEWIGTHFHLDHPESTSHGVVAKVHGDVFDAGKGVPYRNGADWGLGDRVGQAVGERVWRLA